LTEAYSIKQMQQDTQTSTYIFALFNMLYANLCTRSMLGGGAPNWMDEVSQYLKSINDNVTE